MAQGLAHAKPGKWPQKSPQSDVSKGGKSINAMRFTPWAGPDAEFG